MRPHSSLGGVAPAEFINRSLLRGLENVRTEFILTAIACDLRQAITGIGILGIIQAFGA